jgi:hypothetical protein
VLSFLQLVLNVFNSIAIPLRLEQRFADILMYVKTTPSFHKRPWFNDVCIEMETTGEQEKISYGQLHLLFKALLQNVGAVH